MTPLTTAPATSLPTAAAYANNLIGGEWVPSGSGATFDNLDPATGAVLGQYPQSTAEDVDRAVAAAREAFTLWRRYPAPRRADILFRAAEIMTARKEELSRGVSLEMGKVIDEGRGDVQEAIDLAYYFGGEGRRLFGLTTPSESRDKLAYSVRVPIGVIGAISPFNFPFAIPAIKALPALIAGNTVVLKPAEDTPMMASMFAQVMAEAGLPPGVLNVVHGDGEVVGRRLVEHPDVPMISFTGSKAVGVEVTQRSAPFMKNTIMELGGKNCIIVMDDAILDEAVRGILWSAFGTSGQRCTSASRIIVHEKIHDQFVEQLAKATAALTLGPGLDPATDVGPVINRAAIERIDRYVGIGKAEGATLLLGGAPVDGPGCFYQPTLFVGAEPGMRIAQEEIFGPLTAVLKAIDLDDALRIANGIEYGLSAALFTENIGNALRAAELIETGLFYVNAGTTGAEAHLPSGGMKASGNGHREASVSAIDAYTEWRSVYIDYSHRLQRAQIDIDIAYEGG